MISSAFNIGASGLKAAQIGLDVTSHNIANVHTPGYKRQVVDLKEAVQPRNISNLPTGIGVEVSSIHSVTGNTFLEKQLPNAITDSANTEKLSDNLKNIDNILKDYDLSKNINNVLNAYQEIADNPNSTSIKKQAILASKELINNFNSLNDKINDLKINNQKEKTLSLQDINNQLDILSKSKDDSTKNEIINNLSKYMKLDVNQDNSIISSNGKVIYQNGAINKLTLTDLDNITTGSIGALNQINNTIIPNTLDQTSNLMNSFTNKLNETYKDGYDSSGNTGNDLFNQINGQYSLNTEDPNKLQTSSISTPGINDGTIAQNISELRNYKDTNNETFFEKNLNIKNQISFDLNKFNSLNNSNNNYMNNIKSQIDQLSEVNLDEEAVNVLKYQKMYEANAKVIQVADSMIGTLLSIKA